MLEHYTYTVGKGKKLSGNNSFLLLSFKIIAHLWTSATPVTGNVRAVGLPPPVCDEWSTMWGETSELFLEMQKLTKSPLISQ